jgi:hypothetical protein
MAYHFLNENFCLFTMIDKNRLFFFPLNSLYLAIVIYPNYYLLPPSTSNTPSPSLTLTLYRQNIPYIASRQQFLPLLHYNYLSCYLSVKVTNQHILQSMIHCSPKFLYNIVSINILLPAIEDENGVSPKKYPLCVGLVRT